MKQDRLIFKRCLALLLVLVLSISLMPMEPASAKKATKTTVSMKAKKIMFYSDDMPNGLEYTVYYNGKEDIPYVDLCEELNDLASNFKQSSPKSTLKIEKKGNIVTAARSVCGGLFLVQFDFKKNTIWFSDINGFFRNENASLVGADGFEPELAHLFSRQSTSYDRYGRAYKINLNKYGIKLLKDKKRYYIPLQTLNDLFFTRRGATILFNGKSLIAGGGGRLSDAMREIYYSVPKKKNSKAFAAFNYGELCLALDYLYGLKETHDISTFDDFFTDTGLGEMILSPYSIGTDEALATAVNLYFDDFHCGFLDASYNTDQDKLKAFRDSLPQGAYRTRGIRIMNEMNAARAAYYPNGFIPYEEVGDTAYITFDNFEVDESDGHDYSTIPTDADLPTLGKDTLKLMQYSLAKITRSGSPIKRVVLDLSNNGGGEAFAANYVLATFLGSSNMVLKDTITGAMSVADYKTDVNLDGVFDEKDTLDGRGLKLYCLISGQSYSSANLVPSIMKDSDKVTLIGRTSGGGSCAVQPLSTASGTLFQISGPQRISFTKNGGVYDTDRGAEPDIYINDINKIYDRKYVNSVLDGLR